MPQVVTDNLDADEVRFCRSSAKYWAEQERKKSDPKRFDVVRQRQGVFIYTGNQWLRFT